MNDNNDAIRPDLSQVWVHPMLNIHIHCCFC
jgi:hypothetical protein